MVCVLEKTKQNWKQCGYLDGEEEAGIEKSLSILGMMPLTRVGTQEDGLVWEGGQDVQYRS